MFPGNQPPQQTPEQKLRVDCVTRISVGNLSTFDELHSVAGKVLELTHGNSFTAALALNSAAGLVSAGARECFDGDAAAPVILSGLASALSAIFQLAAAEEITVAALLEHTRANLQAEAQVSASNGLQSYFANRGMNPVAP